MEANNLADDGWQDQVAHWAEVLDRWVKGIDTRLGRDTRDSEPLPGDVDAVPDAEP
jgi:hypothetical protein